MQQTDKVKITVIGAGAVGLAVGYILSKKYSDVIIIEKEASFGQGISSRNSEVIHAGIYYQPESLKAKLCIEGNRLMYEFCAENKIPFQKNGKLIVASDKDELGKLESLIQRGRQNGIDSLSMMNKNQIKEMEAGNVTGLAAIFSSSTGIVDTHKLMKTVEAKSKAQGATISYNSEIVSSQKVTDGYQMTFKDGYTLLSEVVVNCAGLNAHVISRMLGVNYPIAYYKGEYFSWSGKNPLKHLVYPVPSDGFGLGIHSVQDIVGGLKFGPNSFAVDKINYDVNPKHKDDFYKAAVKLMPWVKAEKLSPDQSGIRPKLAVAQSGEATDFIIKNEKDKGLNGFVNLIGIESPGLTACLAIGQYVLNLVKQL